MTVDTTTLALTRFANSFVHQNVGDTTTSVRLRLHLDGRTRIGRTTRVGRRRAGPPGRANGRRGAGPARSTLGGAVWLRRPTATDRATSTRRPPRRRRPSGPRWSGRSSTPPTDSRPPATARPRTRGSSFANSAGQHARRGEPPGAALDGIARTGTSDGSAHAMSIRLADLDGARARRAGRDKASDERRDRSSSRPASTRWCSSRSPRPTSCCGSPCMDSTGGRSTRAGRSCDLGEQQFDEAVTLVDDPSGPGRHRAARSTSRARRSDGSSSSRTASPAPSPTTAGRPRRRVRASASTGHAVPGGESFGAVPINLRLEPAPGDVTVDDLRGRGRAGHPGHRLQLHAGARPRPAGGHRADPQRRLAHRGGHDRRRGEELPFHPVVPAAPWRPGPCSGRSSRAEFVPTEVDGLAYAAPALRLASWRFTGGASG